VVCRHVSLTNQGVPLVKKGFGTLPQETMKRNLMLFGVGVLQKLY
jgi:hypothetical protein